MTRDMIDAVIPSAVVPDVWIETWETGLQKWRGYPCS
jgi:hypothetical protein